MGTDEDEDQHDARVVEIVAALLLGVVAGAVLLVAVWVFGRFVVPPRELWDPVIAMIRPVALTSSVLVVIGWLLRSSRRGG